MATGKLKVGLVGAAGRGGMFRSALEANDACIHAVCDLNAERLEACRQQMGGAQAYADYQQMLDQSDLNAVVIGTPMNLHVPQAVAALERGLHVMSEVPAGVSVQECRTLVQAAERSKAVYMMAENYAYLRSNVLVRQLAAKGLFGELYYAEGEYLHDCREINEVTPWRRKWQTGINGITYGTHSLGPILQWFGGDRVVRVCCAGSGHHYKDPRGREYENEDSCVMLCQTARGALIKIRVDLLSNRPHAMMNYQLQGTDGCYESSRGGPVDRGRIFLRSLSREVRWLDAETLMGLDEFAREHLPAIWADPPEALKRAPHGGGDFLVIHDFLNAIAGRAPCPIGVHESMDMTLPGLVSQQSIAQGGAWLDVPDSRTWTVAAPLGPQLHMVWPRRRQDDPPVVRVPDGYELRTYCDADEAGWIDVMAKAGMGDWSAERLAQTIRTVLPDGLFVVIHRASGKLVATAMAQHTPTGMHPYGGQVGWVAADDAHKGKGLGAAVTAAATRRLVQAGYRNIYLLTDDHRLPALKTYLKVGFEPFLFANGMKDRWSAVFGKLGLAWADPAVY